MFFFVAIVLGIIQGFTEFLPVSSSGHLVLIEYIFNVDFDFNLLNVILHFSTLIAVCWFYRKQLLYILKNPFSKTTYYLVLATIPAVLFVILCNSFVETNMSSLTFVGIGFLITSILLFVAEIANKKTTNFSNVNAKNSLILGIAQALAIFPGLSRSGTTLSIGLLGGIKKEEALDFSFLMSIPIILGSLIYETFKTNFDFSSFSVEDVWGVILSSIVAFFCALFSIKFMKNIVNKMKLFYFVPYLVVLSIVCFVLK